MIVGAATDAGCLVWQTECGEEVSCWVYDNATVSKNYFIVGIITKILSLLFFFLAHWFYVPPKEQDIDLSVHNDTKERDQRVQNYAKEQNQSIPNDSKEHLDPEKDTAGIHTTVTSETSVRGTHL